MRLSHFILIFLLITGLSACGSEDLLTPPLFSNVKANGLDITGTSFQSTSVTITGNIDNLAAKIVASKGVTDLSGDVTVVVNPDGSWSFTTWELIEGANLISLAASDTRGNINQMILTVVHDTTPPLISSVIQNLDDPTAPKLLVTFNEKISVTSVTADPFVLDGSPLTGAILETVLTNYIVTLPLSVALSSGLHQLTYTGVSDLAVPSGNVVIATSVPTDSTFDFTIE